MAQITSSTGLISGLDTENIISQLIAFESRPKTAIENRNTVLASQQTAYQTVNAQLLSLKSASSRITSDDAFEATTAGSSNESVATVSSSVGAAVGNYSLTVKQLVSSQQTISRGFTDNDSTFIAPEGGTLTFNRGEARLDRETQLSELNGGQGIDRGYVRVTDRSGNTAVLDFTSVVTVDDVVDTFNSATGVNVFAEIDGDSIRLTDATGQSSSNLIVQDVGATTTASSLGIAGTSGSGTLNGSNINTIGKDSYIASLNDGNGLRTVSGLDDINITTNGGGSFDINLSNAVTLEDLLDTIETATDGDVTGAINAAGTGITLTDNTGGGAGFAVTDLNGGKAGLDLGIIGSDGNGDGDIEGKRVISSINSKLLGALRGGDGLVAFGGEDFTPLAGDTDLADLLQGAGLTTDASGLADLEIVPRDAALADPAFEIDVDALSTVQDLIDAFDSATGGKVTLAIEGQTLVATDNTGGTGDFVIRSANGGSVAEDLGLVISGEISESQGDDLDPTGIAQTAATIDIVNSAGGGGTIDLSGSESVDDLLDKINDAGLGVRASLSNSGAGIKLVDIAGGTGDLTIADGTGSVLATQLGLTGEYDDGQADGGPLGFQFVNEGTRLDNLGVTRGQFTIRDSDGQSATVDLTQGNEQTIADVLSEINSRGLAITARVNDAGDGIYLEDTGSGSVGIQISEEGSTTARDLGILGDYVSGEDVNGSFKKEIEVLATDTLQSLALKINDANVGVNAAVINDGSAAAPYRLSLSSDVAGTGGAFTLDDNGLGLEVNNLAEAKDAVVFYGGDDPTNSIVVTSKSNTLTELIPGADISLLSVSDDPIQITISDDPSSITTAVSDFVNSFNSLVDSMDSFDSYNADTEERGLLLGDSALARVRTSIYNAVIGANTALTGQFNSLSQIGVSVGSGARLQFDSEQFQSALNADPEGVRDLFTFEQFEVDPETGEDTEEIVAQGVGAEIDALLERLTDSTDGALERQVQILQDQIDLNNSRIEAIDQTIEDKQARLELEFSNLELVLAGLQDQQSALTQLSALQTSSQTG